MWTTVNYGFYYLFQTYDILLLGRLQLVATSVPEQPQPRLADGIDTANHITSWQSQPRHMHRLLRPATALLPCTNRFRGMHPISRFTCETTSDKSNCNLTKFSRHVSLLFSHLHLIDRLQPMKTKLAASSPRSTGAWPNAADNTLHAGHQFARHCRLCGRRARPVHT